MRALLRQVAPPVVTFRADVLERVVLEAVPNLLRNTRLARALLRGVAQFVDANLENPAGLIPAPVTPET
jgi:hypothetical protein